MDRIGGCVATHLVIGLDYLRLNIKQEKVAMKNETDELCVRLQDIINNQATNE
jgi:hypothetical protein